MLSALPLELILLLLSYFDKKTDEDTLKSLSLTSSAFVNPCRSLLFYHINLISRGSGRRLLDLLSSSPGIATYVRRVTISDSVHTVSRGGWLHIDLSLGAALGKLRLRQVHGFTLNLQAGSRWDSLCPTVRRSIIEICGSPVLVDLDLLWAPLPLVNVCCPSLKNLRLFHPSLGAATDIIPTPRPFDIVLESLELCSALDGVAEFLLDPSNQLRLDELQELEVSAYSSAYHPHVQLLLDRSRGSLETLHLRTATQITSPTEHMLSISHCHKLTALYLTVDATDQSHRVATPLSLTWAATFISHIPSRSAIEVIGLDLHFDLRTVGGGLGGQGCWVMFSALRNIGEFVSKPTSLPRLEALEVEIHSERAGDTGNLRTWVREALPILQRRSMLRLV